MKVLIHNGQNTFEKNLYGLIEIAITAVTYDYISGGGLSEYHTLHEWLHMAY